MTQCISAVLWCVLALGHIAAGSLLMDVNPETISPNLTPSLTVNCTFSYTNMTDLSSIISLIVSRADIQNNQSQKFIELASINAFASDHVNHLTQINASASGRIGAGSDMSYLSLVWIYPSGDESGLYHCAAHGVDMTGHPVVLSTTAQVSSGKPGLDQLIEKLNILQSAFDHLQQVQSALQDKMSNQSQTIQTLRSELASQERNYSQTIAALQTELSEWESHENNQSDQIAALQAQSEIHKSIFDSLLLSTFHAISHKYKGRYYLLSKGDFQEASTDEETCEQFGGYLAEIDDREEHEFIKTFLYSTSGMAWALVGATDEEQEGHWVFRHSGQPMTYTDWSPGHPNSENCVELAKQDGWQMRTYSCTSLSTHVKFLCEVPTI